MIGVFRRYLLGFGLSLAAAVPVWAGLQLAAGCNEPLATTYGNPNGLDRKNLPGEGGAEPLVCADGAFDGGCPSFATDIFPYMKGDGKWQCASAGCHGGASSPQINGADPAGCLTSLKAITVAGKPYVPAAGGNTDPTQSSILCNMQGACGSRMPKAPGSDPTPTELCAIEAWVKCGTPP
jgi:hypothetical protein